MKPNNERQSLLKNAHLAAVPTHWAILAATLILRRLVFCDWGGVC
jgi:hypothetical protein